MCSTVVFHLAALASHDISPGVLQMVSSPAGLATSIDGLVFCQYNLQSLEGVFHGSFRGIGCFYTSMVAGKCIFLSLIINQCILINVFVATLYGIPGSHINCPSDYARWWWPYASFVSTLGLSTYTLTHLMVLVCMLYSFMFLILLSDSPMSLALSGG